jgi:thiosulfate reductase cytochrome b subunit
MSEITPEDRRKGVATVEGRRFVYLHPGWVRLWHWINVVLIILLAATGFSLHFGGESSGLLSFRTARLVHNACGWIVLFTFVLYLVGLIVSGEWRQFLVFKKGFVRGMFIQTGFYLSGIFRGQPHPDSPTRERKFNPLQQITYLLVVVVGLPLIILTGMMLLLPESAPKQVMGAGGIWPIAMAHTVVGYGLVAFMLGHMYLTTLGHSAWSNILGMFTGWTEEPEHESPEPPAGEEKEPGDG